MKSIRIAHQATLINQAILELGVAATYPERWRTVELDEGTHTVALLELQISGFVLEAEKLFREILPHITVIDVQPLHINETVFALVCTDTPVTPEVALEIYDAIADEALDNFLDDLNDNDDFDEDEDEDEDELSRSRRSRLYEYAASLTPDNSDSSDDPEFEESDADEENSDVLEFEESGPVDLEDAPPVGGVPVFETETSEQENSEETVVENSDVQLEEVLNDITAEPEFESPDTLEGSIHEASDSQPEETAGDDLEETISRIVDDVVGAEVQEIEEPQPDVDPRILELVKALNEKEYDAVVSEGSAIVGIGERVFEISGATRVILNKQVFAYVITNGEQQNAFMTIQSLIRYLETM